MQQIVSVDSKSPKGALFGAQMGTLKKGVILPPFRWGSEIGSKVEDLGSIRL